MMRYLLTSLLLLCSNLQAEHPNIVIIFADDLGYGDMQANNPDRCKIATPNMDGLAAEGMRFTDGHSSSGCCSPSRYTLLTGRYHWRTTLQRGIVESWGKPLIAPERLTIGKLAQQQGYRTPSLREGPWKLVAIGDPIKKTPVQLYNLDEDLGEKNNLAYKHPDRVMSMQNTMEKLIRSGRSTDGEPQKNDITVVRYPKAISPAKGNKSKWVLD